MVGSPPKDAPVHHEETGPEEDPQASVTLPPAEYPKDVDFEEEEEDPQEADQEEEDPQDADPDEEDPLEADSEEGENQQEDALMWEANPIEPKLIVVVPSMPLDEYYAWRARLVRNAAREAQIPYAEEILIEPGDSTAALENEGWMSRHGWVRYLEKEGAFWEKSEFRLWQWTDKIHYFDSEGVHPF